MSAFAIVLGLKVGLPQEAAPKIVDVPQKAVPEVVKPPVADVSVLTLEGEAPVFDASVVSVYGADGEKADDILVIVDTLKSPRLDVRADGGHLQFDSNGETFEVPISEQSIEIYNASVYPVGTDKIRIVLEVFEIQPEKEN